MTPSSSTNSTPSWDIEQIEELCSQLYQPSADPVLRQQADKCCSNLHNRSDCLAICKLLLQRSKLVAATALARRISDPNIVLPSKDRIEIRDCALHFLANNPNLEAFVQQALIGLISCITKSGWLDDTDDDDSNDFRKIIPYTVEFIESGQPKVILLGVQIFNQLVQDISRSNDVYVPRFMLYCRQLLTSFREKPLLTIFRLGVNLLIQASKSQDSLNVDQLAIASQCLRLLHSCLSFDFTGTGANSEADLMDEAGAECVNRYHDVIALPATWRSTLRDCDLINLLFRLFQLLPKEAKALVLSCLIQLASVRRSLFNSAERLAYLDQLFTGLHNLLANLPSSAACDDDVCRHELCRLLARLTFNFQLTELSSIQCYSLVVQQVVNFTVSLLGDESNTANAKSSSDGGEENSLHYLLYFWRRLVHVLALADPEIDSVSQLAQVPFRVVEAYIGSRLSRLDRLCQSSQPLASHIDDGDVGDGDWFDALQSTNSGTMDQQFDLFAPIARSCYAKTCGLLFEHFDQSLERYSQTRLVLFEAASSSDSTSLNSSEMIGLFHLLQHRLAWLIQLMSILVSNRSTHSLETDELDAEAIARVIRMVHQTNLLMMATNEQAATNIVRFLTSLTGAHRLELALMAFLEKFRRIYLGDSVNRTASVCHALSTTLQLSDDTVIMNLFVSKIMLNFKLWSSSSPILKRTIALMSDLSRSRTSMQRLLCVPEIQSILVNHSESHFPFLSSTPDSFASFCSRARLRTTFFSTLTRLLLPELEQDIQQFNQFITPLGQTTNQLIMILLFNQNTSNLTNDHIRASIVGLARDLRGISQMCNTNASYKHLVYWFYPSGLKLLNHVVELWPNDQLITVPVLKLVNDLVQNRNGRITFNPVESIGNLLFSQLSLLLQTFGNQFSIQQPIKPQSDEFYSTSLKPIGVLLNCLATFLGSGCLNFGLFTLYGDDSLEKALEAGVKLMLQVDPEKLLEYRKVTYIYLTLLEYLFHQHLIFVASLGNSVMQHFLKVLEHSLLSTDPKLVETACDCVDHFASALFDLVQRKRQHSDNEPGQLIDIDAMLLANGSTSLSSSTRLVGARRFSTWANRTPLGESNLIGWLESDSVTADSGSSFIQRLLVTLLSSVVQQDCQMHHSMTRPLLPLILINYDYFVSLQASIAMSVNSEHRGSIEKLFAMIMEDVELNLKSANRDKLLRNLSLFKVELADFIKGANSSSSATTTTTMSDSSMVTSFGGQPSLAVNNGQALCLSSLILESSGCLPKSC